MKQGHSNNTYKGKPEPIPHAVNPGGAAQIGRAMATAREVIPIYAGRGYKAPSIGNQSYPRGSQGKHR